MDDLKNKISSFLKGEVDNSAQAVEKYSCDASLFKIKPSLIVFPKDREDIKNLVKLVKSEKARGRQISITARSGGTDMAGGPLNEAIILDMTRHFKQTKEIGGDYAFVQPGVFYRDFDKIIRAKNLMLPSYPASKDICTLGGMVANNSGGEKTLVYGKTEKYTQEIKAVLEDGNEYLLRSLSGEELEEKKKQNDFEGELYRKMHNLLSNNYELLRKAKPKVSKNSSGYFLWDVWDKDTGIFDLTKLFVGSQGTLGVITEIKLGLVKPKPHSRMLLIFLKDLSMLDKLINHVLAFGPESFESYDDHTLKVAIKLFPELVKKLKGNLLILFLKFLPEFWMVLTGGVPKLVLIAEFTGDTTEEAYKKAKDADGSLKIFNLQTKVTRSAGEADKYWLIRRESFSLLRRNLRGLHTAPFIDDIIVRPEQLPDFLPRLNGILNNYDIIYTIAGHVGDANFHIIPLMDLHNPESKRIIVELSQKVYKLVFEFGGSMSGEHNDGLIRSPFLEQMYGPEVYKLFEETKKIFDPENIFNPGKKTGASLEYAMEHLDV